MSAARAPRLLTPPPAPGSAEEAILMLLYALIGDGRKDHGLRTRVYRGTRHIPTCMVGYCVREGDSQRGGQPCSERCVEVQQAIDAATAWLYANRPPTQVGLGLEEVAS